MKTYTFSSGSLNEGLVVMEDAKLGIVVFLGEEGRGRRYEKVGLLRKNPADVVEEAPLSGSLPRFGGNKKRIMEAHPVQITLNKGTDKEKSFYTLAKPENGNSRKALVRINTCGVYTRGSAGSWKTVKGQPEELVKAYGARGDAGRIGSWDDGLVVMSVGDVIRVKPEGGHKTKAYALVYDVEKGLTSMSYADYEILAAMDEVEAETEVPVKLTVSADNRPAVAETPKTVTITIDLLQRLMAGNTDMDAVFEATELLPKS